MADRLPVVITVAVNGGAQQSRDGAFVPITPQEIAEEAALCEKAGATCLHFHARDKDGKNTGDPAIYTEIMNLVRARTKLLIQPTNGIGSRLDPATGQYSFPNDEERLKLMRLDPPPDFYGAATGSIDFYNPEGGYPGEASFPNSGTFLQETIRMAYGRGSTIEFEVPHVTALHRLHRYLLQEGVDPASPYIMLVMPIFPAFCPDIRAFMYLQDEGRRLFPNAIRNAGGRWSTVTLGLALGYEVVRVGFEGSLHLPDGTVARRNYELIEKLVEIAAIYGRRPATPDEGRAILHLDRKVADQKAAA